MAFGEVSYPSMGLTWWAMHLCIENRHNRAHCSVLKTAVLSCITCLDFELKCEPCTGSNKGYLGLQSLLYVLNFRIDIRMMY